MMEKMGFCDRWVRWIMLCVSSVSYSVLVNDDSVGPIVPGRGLREGDPLSPYLFLICAQGLTCLIKRAEGRGDIHGIQICQGAPSVSHLLFADDSFLFFRASERECNVMKSILATFEAASGQAVNFNKSEICYSKNVDDGTRLALSNILGVQTCLGSGKYLGLPSLIGRKKKATFNYLKDRVRKKINSWSGRHLSKAGREVLVKSVLQAIPAYCMSVFLLPHSLAEEIERMMNSF